MIFVFFLTNKILSASVACSLLPEEYSLRAGEDSQTSYLDDVCGFNTQEFQESQEHGTLAREGLKLLILAHKGVEDLNKKVSLRDIHEKLGLDEESIAIIIPSDQQSEEEPSYQYRVVGLEEYSNDVAFDRGIDTLRRAFPFTHIFALGEYDVLRASRTRRQYHLPGMREEECSLFRNKLTMIDLIQRSRLRAPYSQGIRTFTSLRSFIRKHLNPKDPNKKYPIIIKPVAGVSGKDTWVIKDLEAFEILTKETVFSKYFPDASIGDQAVLIAQKFIKYDMFHLDGRFNPGGKILWSWPSLYDRPPLQLQAGESVSSSILEDCPFAHYLNAYAKKVMEAMSGNIKTPGIFHLEGFYAPGLREMEILPEEPSFEKIIFCEIACRPGGFTIPRQWERSFETNLIEAAIKLEIGMELPKIIPGLPQYLSMGVITNYNTTIVLQGKSERELQQLRNDTVQIEEVTEKTIRKRTYSAPEEQKPENNKKKSKDLPERPKLKRSCSIPAVNQQPNKKKKPEGTASQNF